ncbi:hypothetical protein [Trabulsiella odontotermitis]|jgi:hypothetical protein|uniref:hypothetical protein n=1 Tax=Trabulsiella odontotermitis TaxID=379893 RepID=UPI0006BA589A|nr:hypothetical protein [Trabulsiella odontotermitis]
MKKKIIQRRINRNQYVNPEHIVKIDWLSHDEVFVIQIVTGERITLDKQESHDLMDYFDFKNPL